MNDFSSGSVEFLQWARQSKIALSGSLGKESLAFWAA